MFWIIAISLLVIVLAVTAGVLMLWKLPVPKKGSAMPEQKQISVIIPARNEESRIVPLLESIERQQWEQLEVIVVDDGSIDQTAAVATSYGCRVIANNNLDEDWVGKSAACWRGANMAEGDYLLFLDADTQFRHSDSIQHLGAAFQKDEERGILSVQPYHTIERAYENLSSIFNIILVAGMNVFTPWTFKGAGSFGPCILCSREDYFVSGGHGRRKGAIMDDFALAEAFESIGQPVRCYGGHGLIDFQMYPEGMGQLMEGWTKNFATASQSTHPLVMSFISIWISGGFLTLPSLAIAFILGYTPLGIVAAMLYVIFTLQLFWLARRTGNFHFWPMIFHPLLFLFFTALFLRSLYLTKVKQTVNWRGRKIKV